MFEKKATKNRNEKKKEFLPTMMIHIAHTNKKKPNTLLSIKQNNDQKIKLNVYVCELENNNSLTE